MAEEQERQAAEVAIQQQMQRERDRAAKRREQLLEEAANEQMPLWFNEYQTTKPNNNNNNNNNNHSSRSSHHQLQRDEEREMMHFGMWVHRGGFHIQAENRVADNAKTRAFQRYAKAKKKANHRHPTTMLEFGNWCACGGLFFDVPRSSSRRDRKRKSSR
ncbi:uncharacterized protein [Clytia hemisphaerica]|uniref:uncharacterized protein n=1 Tax=Clytia hemisphaerica TaxID=252671 RepID=UPI0034D3F90A